MLMLYSVKEWNLTYEKICSILKKTNHTTVLHGIKKIKNYLNYDSDLRFKYMMLNEYVFGSLEYYKL